MKLQLIYDEKVLENNEISLKDLAKSASVLITYLK